MKTKLPRRISVFALAFHWAFACAGFTGAEPPPTGLRSFHLAEWRNADHKKTFEVALSEKAGGWVEGSCRRYVLDSGSEKNQKKHVVQWVCKASVFERMVDEMFLNDDFDCEAPEPDCSEKKAAGNFTYQFQQATGMETNSWTRTTQSNLETLFKEFLAVTEEEKEEIPTRVNALMDYVPGIGFCEHRSGADAFVWKEFSEYYSSGELAWHYAVETRAQMTNSGDSSFLDKAARNATPSVAADFTSKWFHRFPDHVEESIECIEENFFSRRETKMWLSCKDYAEGIATEIAKDSHGNPTASMPTTCRWMFSRDEWQDLIERCFDNQRSIDYWPLPDELGFYRGEEKGKITVVATKGGVNRQFSLRTDADMVNSSQKLPNVLYEIFRLVPYRLHLADEGEAWNVKAATGTLARHLSFQQQHTISDLYISPRFYEMFKNHDGK
jgi:hypothetical protein